MKNYLNSRKRIMLLGFLVMVLTTIPYLIGYFCQGESWRFTGFLIAVEDGNSYIAKMLSGASGNWLFRSPFSAENQMGALAFFPYLLLGKLTAGTAQHEQLVVLFHLYRILAGTLASLAIYDFLALLLKKESRRIGALIVILLGGGLGWVITIAGMKNFLGSIPLDFLSPESFGFLGLFGLPHLVLARALLFWGITSYLTRNSGYKAGLLWLLMGFFQPIFIVVIWAVSGVHSLLEMITAWARRSSGKVEWEFSNSALKRTIQAGLVSSPMVVYNAAALYFDPYLSAWTTKMDLASPHFIHYFLAYGTILPLAILGVRDLIKIKKERGLFLAGWLAIFPLLIFAPVNPQRRLAEGIWVIVVSAMFIFFENKEKIPFYGKIILGCTFPTAIFILVGAAGRATSPSAPVFLEESKVSAYQSMAVMVPDDSIVLSTFEVGNTLPAWVPVRVVLGHGAETVHLNKWTGEVEGYFSDNQGNIDCGMFLHDNQIDYIFWGPAEEQTWDWDPEIKSCLKRIYNSQGYRIFTVE